MKKYFVMAATAILTVCTITVGCSRNRQADRQQSAEQRTAEARIEEMEPAFEGTYLDENNSPNLLIERKGTGMYRLEIGIFRLTTLSDAVGKVEGDRLEFTATDAAGNPIGGDITLRGARGATGHGALRLIRSGRWRAATATKCPWCGRGPALRSSWSCKRRR